MKEETLVLIKPDAVERNLIGNILSVYEKNDLKIKDMKMIHASKSIAEAHYMEHKGRPYFDRLIRDITRSPIVAVKLEGDDAIKRVRTLNGVRNIDMAEEGTIRKMYALSSEENAVHGSDSSENAQRELSIWFS